MYYLSGMVYTQHVRVETTLSIVLQHINTKNWIQTGNVGSYPEYVTTVCVYIKPEVFKQTPTPVYQSV